MTPGDDRLERGSVCQWASRHLAPSPLISAGMKVVTSIGEGHWLTDGRQDVGFWEVPNPTAARPGSASFDVGRGPTRLALRWTALNGAYEDLSNGAPSAYRIETSATSTDGTNGEWSLAVHVTNGTTTNAAHAFDFTGKRWVRFVVEGIGAASATRASQLNEIQLFDASAGLSDAWIFFGDSITAMSLHGGEGSFAEDVHRSKPAFYPLMLAGGTGGTHSGTALDRIDAWIAMNADVRFCTLDYGTNDAAGDADGARAGEFDARMRTLLDKLIAAGKVPVIPRIPAQRNPNPTIEKYNLVIDRLQVEYGLCAGPDLYAHFAAHTDEFADDIHPNDKGQESINRLWAEAMLRVYPR